MSIHRNPSARAHTASRITLLCGVALPGLIWLTATPAQAADARELGPMPVMSWYYTGRVSAVACSPTNANLYYIAGADGGVWKTEDAGETFVPLTDHMPTTAMGALAIDPTNENIIYAGTGEANYANHSRFGLGIFKSTDAGATWTHLAESTFAGRTFSRLLIHPTQPQTLYAAIARAGGFPEMAAAKHHPGATGPVGVFRSDDGGVNWTHLTGGLPNLAATDLAMDPVDFDVLYAAIGHIFGDSANGIYKTTDGGATWSKLAGGLPASNLGRISVAVAPSDRQRLYALFSNAAAPDGDGASMLGAFRSDDAGQSWSALPNLGNIQATYGWFLSYVIVHRTNPDIVFMAGLNLMRSMDGGANWGNASPPHVDQHAAAWDAAGRLLAGDDGGVHLTDDLGNLWYPLNGTLGLIQFYAGVSTHPTNDAILFGGTQDNGTNFRNADSTSWWQLLGGDGGWTQIDPLDPLRMFGEFQGSGNLYRSLNGGANFAKRGTGINGGDRNCFLPPYLIVPGQSARMLYATHRIYQTGDGANTWTPLSGDLTDGTGAIRTLAIAPSDPNVVYAATTDGRVQKSVDGGANFTLISSGLLGWPRTTRELFVHPQDPDTVYQAVGAFGTTQLRRTTDGGQTWDALSANFPDLPANTIAADVRTNPPTLYVGAEDGVYRSLDDGQTWGRFGRNLPRTPVVDLRLEPARERLVVVTQGRGAWLLPLPCPGDANCDGVVTWRDIDYFIAALNDNEAAWEALFAPAAPLCPFLGNDVNGDGHVTWRDIDPFVARLNTVCP